MERRRQDLAPHPKTGTDPSEASPRAKSGLPLFLCPCCQLVFNGIPKGLDRKQGLTQAKRVPERRRVCPLFSTPSEASAPQADERTRLRASIFTEDVNLASHYGSSAKLEIRRQAYYTSQ